MLVLAGSLKCLYMQDIILVSSNYETTSCTEAITVPTHQCASYLPMIHEVICRDN